MLDNSLLKAPVLSALLFVVAGRTLATTYYVAPKMKKGLSMNKTLRMKMAALLTVWLGATVAFADVTYYVRPMATGETIDGGVGTEKDPFHHPQAAINAAAGTELTTIILMPGTYGVWNQTYGDNKVGNYKTDESRVINIGKSNIHIQVQDTGDAWPVVLNAGSDGCTRAIQVKSGLENVKISGVKTIGGWSTSNQSGDRHPTCLCAFSGTFEDCLFVGKRRVRCGYISLSGAAVTMRRCELTEDASPSFGASGGGGTFVLLTVAGGAQVDGCYVHDAIYASGNAAACAGQGISVSGTGSLVRNTIVKNVKCGSLTMSGGNGAGIYVGAGATVENCTVTGCTNVKDACGGLYVASSTAMVRNCIVWGNTGATDAPINDIGFADGVPASCVQYCVSTTGVVLNDGNNNLNMNPELSQDDGFSIAADSPVAGKGLVDDTWMFAAMDYKGNPRLYDGTVSPGAVEPQGRISKFTATPRFEGEAVGHGTLSVVVDALVDGTVGDCMYSWDFGDGSDPVLSTTTRAAHDYGTVGYFEVRLTVTDDKGDHLSDALYATVVGETCYVSTNGAAIPPYDTWAKATSNIQDAADLNPGAILVSNGVYLVGFTESDRSGIKLSAATRLVSVNGPDETIIAGGTASPSQAQGSNVGRTLVTMSHADASVEGFTFEKTIPPMIVASAGRFERNVIRNPYPWAGSGDQVSHRGCDFGGTSAITNCVFDGSLMNGSGVNASLAWVCLREQASMDRCRILNAKVELGKTGAGNPMRTAVAVLESASLRNSYVTGWSAKINPDKPIAQAFAAWVKGTMENCTVTDSDITAKGGGAGINVLAGANVRNVISVGHVVTVESVTSTNDVSVTGDPMAFENNLIGVGELPETAKGCIVGEDPCFVDDGSGYRITKDSPCYNKGTPVSWASKKGKATDIDGQERHCGPIDIGCWELQRPLGLVLFVQ